MSLKPLGLIHKLAEVERDIRKEAQLVRYFLGVAIQRMDDGDDRTQIREHLLSAIEHIDRIANG